MFKSIFDCRVGFSLDNPAAMMMAFRSIPAYLAICREMEKRCPRVVLLNHSNPMAEGDDAHGIMLQD